VAHIVRFEARPFSLLWTARDLLFADVRSDRTSVDAIQDMPHSELFLDCNRDKLALMRSPL
jgi:hypothetical protein